MRPSLDSATLYGIIDLGYVLPEDFVIRAQQLVAGGIDLLQLRAKGCDLGDIEQWCLELLPLCREAKIPFIVNDYPEIAKKVGSDGVHIGQEDGSLEQTRSIVGEQMIVGRSTHSLEQAQTALAEGFDYIGFGPLYPTPTKKGRPAIGLDEVSLAEKAVGTQIPMFCIGGVKVENLEEVMTAGARRVVVVSGLLTAIDPIAEVKAAKAKLSS